MANVFLLQKYILTLLGSGIDENWEMKKLEIFNLTKNVEKT